MTKILKTFMFISFLFILVSCNKTEYKLVLDANGGLINNEKIQTIVKNSDDDDLSISLDIPTKEGYNFVGWSKNGVILADNSILLDSDITLIAKYDVIKYSISYQLNGGILENKVVEYTVEDELELGIPTKEGYTFTSWNNGITKISKGTTGDITLIAEYSVNKYKIN